jgi:hypothetical protein
MGNRSTHDRRRKKQAQKREHIVTNSKTPEPTSHGTRPTQKEEKNEENNEGGGESKQKYRLFETLGILASILGVALGIPSFYPRLTVSEPTPMDVADLFSYQITVANDGILPVFRTKWSLALRSLRVDSPPSAPKTTFLLPHYADWQITSELMRTVTRADREYHTAIAVAPGGTLIDPGPPNYGFHLSPPDNYIGMLAPGDKSTFTTEGLVGAPIGAQYDSVDFAIALRYVPLFPPIPMQVCSNFLVHRDRTGTQHWFRAPNRCDRFPWMHNWFPEKGALKPATHP